MNGWNSQMVQVQKDVLNGEENWIKKVVFGHWSFVQSKRQIGLSHVEKNEPHCGNNGNLLYVKSFDSQIHILTKCLHPPFKEKGGAASCIELRIHLNSWDFEKVDSDFMKFYVLSE